MKVADLLREGKENAVPLAALVNALGIDGRTVRLMIRRERLSGTPILSDTTAGYFLPSSEEEKMQFVASMQHRAGEIQEVADAVEVIDWKTP